MSWYQQFDNEQRRRWEEMLLKMEREVEQGRMIMETLLTEKSAHEPNYPQSERCGDN